ncbi:MAG: DNA primase [Candidatus Magasanikbacteria bacterium]|nr:DNA primase [Candidatus Magasanikbacteria bacterium]
MSDTQLIKDKIDVVDLIGEYVQLKPSGINHKGLCPFHHEKSPSFMVNRERQSWHCFGCAKGGDIFSFIQEIENLEFVDALKLLAQKAGVVLTSRGENQAESSQKSRIKDINRAATAFFHHILTQLPAAEPAREYIKQRGLTQETIVNWQIGFIPDQWELLTKYLLKKGFSIDDLVASGLTIKRDNADRTSNRGFYDRFRGRIMFPIWDVHDSIVGFTGRVLVETETSGGKYVNSPQSPSYDKSRVLFGLNKAKRAIKENDLAVLVEGQMDVIACHQAGMTNVVATSGTALTDEQIKLLQRYTTNLAMAFDADLAGQNAAKRGIDLAREAGLQVRVIRIPEGAGKDPDECLKKNPDVWTQSVQNARDVMEWFIEKSLGAHDLTNPRGRQSAVNEVLVEIKRIPYALERDYWLKTVAGKLGEEIQVLRDNMKEVSLPTVAKTAPIILEAKNTQTNPHDPLMGRILALLVKFPGIISLMPWKDIGLEAAAQASSYAPLYLSLKEEYTASSSFSLENLRLRVQKEGVENMVDLLALKAEMDFANVSEKDARNEFRVLCETVGKNWKKQRVAELSQAMRQAEAAGDQVKANALLEELNRII